MLSIEEVVSVPSATSVGSSEGALEEEGAEVDDKGCDWEAAAGLSSFLTKKITKQKKKV